MAEIGMKGFWVATLTEDSQNKTLIYKNGVKMAKAVSADVTYAISEAELYADNGLAKSKRAITKGDMSIVSDDITEEEIFSLYGVTRKSKKINGIETEVLSIGVNTEGSYVGFGYISNEDTDKKGEQVKVTVFPKVKFSPPANKSNASQGANMAYTTPAVTGKILPDFDGDFEFNEFFETEDEAIEFLETVFSVEIIE